MLPRSSRPRQRCQHRDPARVPVQLHQQVHHVQIRNSPPRLPPASPRTRSSSATRR
jgi:hypothetical protein